MRAAAEGRGARRSSAGGVAARSQQAAGATLAGAGAGHAGQIDDRARDRIRYVAGRKTKRNAVAPAFYLVSRKVGSTSRFLFVKQFQLLVDRRVFTLSRVYKRTLRAKHDVAFANTKSTAKRTATYQKYCVRVPSTCMNRLNRMNDL